MTTTYNRIVSPAGIGRLLGVLIFCMGNSAIAATSIFVQNNTGFELSVDSIEVTGSSLSKKAWKRGKTSITHGSQERVLTVNRTGKFNWMDPTPRFIEPGKTAVFSVALSIPNDDGGKPILLRLKLLGTGSTSKMWYMISGTDKPFDWAFETKQFTGQWTASSDVTIDFTYRAYKEGDNTHVAYEFTETD